MGEEEGIPDITASYAKARRQVAAKVFKEIKGNHVTATWRVGRLNRAGGRQVK